MTAPYTLTVNGARHEVADGWLGESLLYVLRERLGLPGSKAGCEQGECGSCSVIIDGRLECACLVMAAAAVGRAITTVEGLQPERGGFTAVQEAFLAEGAVQCGFCTPGLVVALTDLLARNPQPSDLEVREAISGNLCRCTGYGRVLAATHAAAQPATHPAAQPATHPAAQPATHPAAHPAAEVAAHPAAEVAAHPAAEVAADAAAQGAAGGTPDSMP